MKNVCKIITLCGLLIAPSAQLFCMEQTFAQQSTSISSAKTKKCSCNMVTSAAVAAGSITGLTAGIAAFGMTVSSLISHIDPETLISDGTVFSSSMQITAATLSAAVGGAFLGYNGIKLGYKGISCMKKKLFSKEK